MRRLLFLCTGNYYRSRFAEIYFNWHAQQRQIGWRAESRGLALTISNRGAMSHYTLSRLEHHGIPHDSYDRLPLDVQSEDFAVADHIVAVKETEHRPLIVSRFPDWLPRVQFWEVHDLDCAEPEHAFPQLERHILDLIEHFAAVT